MRLKTKAGILTTTIIFVFFILQIIDFGEWFRFNEDITKSFIISALLYFGLYWVLGFKIRGIRFLTILGHSAYIIFIQSLFIELVIFQDVARISEKTFSFLILLIWGLSIYFLFLTANILNVSYISRIPLAQAAKASNFLYNLFSAYFSFLLILRLGIPEVYKLLLFLAVIFILTLNMFWFKKESRTQLFGETFAVVLFMMMLFVIMIMWPIPVELAALLYIVVFYILVSLGLEERETTSFIMRVEYILLLLVSIFLLLKLSVWGINGSII